MKASVFALFFISAWMFATTANAQMITGVWKGKINRQKAEVKIIQTGDSLTGTAYYYESANNYRRYSIKGYFDATTNEAVWWDDQLVDEKPVTRNSSGKVPFLSRADFNCPGDGRMMLDGKSGRRSDDNPQNDMHLDKIPDPVFPDEWDYVIDNYTMGGNDPYIIDSIRGIVLDRVIVPAQETVRVQTPVPEKTSPVTTSIQQPVPKTVIPPVNPPTIEEKFAMRKKVLVTEIPLVGDSIELRFYDNAEIDGDSISLFLNEKLIFQHIRLLGTAYTIRLAIAELQQVNELIMVAENLGSIPPNTSYMVALIGEKRYEARLESTEGSSAMIRMLKP